MALCLCLGDLKINVHLLLLYYHFTGSNSCFKLWQLLFCPALVLPDTFYPFVDSVFCPRHLFWSLISFINSDWVKVAAAFCFQLKIALYNLRPTRTREWMNEWMTKKKSPNLKLQKAMNLKSSCSQLSDLIFMNEMEMRVSVTCH